MAHCRNHQPCQLRITSLAFKASQTGNGSLKRSPAQIPMLGGFPRSKASRWDAITGFRGFSWSPSGSSAGLVSRVDAFEMNLAAKPVVLQDRRVLVTKRDKVGAQAQKVLQVPAVALPKIIPFISTGFESQLL